MRMRVSKRGLAAVTVLGLAVAAAEAYALCPEVRGACAGPLAWAGADDRLAALAAEDHPAVYAPATAALRRRGPAAVPALVRRADRPGDPARGVAVSLLGRIGPPARDAAPCLKRLARDDPDPRVRGAAVGALVAVAPADPDTLTLVAGELDSADADVRATAVEYLQCPEFPADRVAPLLARVLAGDRACTRRAAAEGLGRLGAAGAPALAAALDDADEGVRAAARAALDAVGAALGDAARAAHAGPPACPTTGCAVAPPPGGGAGPR